MHSYIRFKVICINVKENGMDIVDFIEAHPLITAILVIAFVVGIVTVPAYVFASNQCSSKAAVLNADYKFGFYEGCFIKEDGKWVDYDRYRIINRE